MDKKLKSNVIALMALQIGNYLVPLIVFPYLARVLGAEGFGRFGFAMAFTAYFVLFVDWGFNLSSTRNIAISRADKSKRSIVFWETIASRLVLTFASVVIFYVLLGNIQKLNEESTLLWLGMLQVLAATLSTAFYYQGIEKMRSMATTNLVIRLASIPLVIFIVKYPEQVVLAFAIQTTSFLIASLANLWALLRSDEIVWVMPKQLFVRRALIDSSPLFLSSAGTSLYTNSNAVILGFVASEAAVGYFVAGFTLVKAVVGLSGPFSQAMFPRISLVLNLGPSTSETFVKKMVYIQSLLGFTLSIGLAIFLPWGITWFYGESFREVIYVVAWLVPLPFVVCLGSALGMQTLIPLGKTRWFAGVLLSCGILNCLMLIPFGSAWGAVGAAAAVLVTELAIVIGMAIGVKWFAPKIFRVLTRFL